METKRKYYIDLIKIVSILFVIYNHTGDNGFLLYQHTTSNLAKIGLLLLSVICKSGVPLFLMCSGSLLLYREESWKTIWKKRVLKYGLVIVIFTTIYWIYLSMKDGSPITHSGFLWIMKTMYETSTFSYSGAYWYLYLYIGFLITLPVLTIIARHLDKELMMYILGINIFFGNILVILEWYFGVGRIALDLSIITNILLLYPMLGYYIDWKSEEWMKNRIMKLCVGGGIIALLVSECCTLKNLSNGILTQDYLYVFGVFIAISIYICCKRIIQNKLSYNKKWKIVKKCLTFFGGCSFGVYLIHGIIMTEWDIFIGKYGIEETYPVVCVKVIFVWLICCLIIGLIKKIPIIKKLL